ncbi:MAG: hypothetical protein AMK69_08845 [Nitrospira bacterium SG8_3]|nr:MAG: hypothetical protein AMK69_08845 [Nitrospira bacterium SG8_3]
MPYACEFLALGLSCILAFSEFSCTGNTAGLMKSFIEASHEAPGQYARPGAFFCAHASLIPHLMLNSPRAGGAALVVSVLPRN